MNISVWKELPYVAQVIVERKSIDEHLVAALCIFNEINCAWGFPEKNLELSRYQTIGYMSEIGNPHQWWEQNSEAYAKASIKFPRGRDLNSVCLLATAMLKQKNIDAKTQTN